MSRSSGLLLAAPAAVITVALWSGLGAAAPVAVESSHCGGVWRWDVKTLSDERADQVKLTPQSATVRGLNKLTRPRKPVHTDTPRYKRVESKTYRVTGLVVEAKRSDDKDIHLVIRDLVNEKKTMIIEFPDVKCRGAAISTFKAGMKKARGDFAAACGGEPGSHFRRLMGTATIVGVGFWDKNHGQKGFAQNFIELHPALSFESEDCQRP